MLYGYSLSIVNEYGLHELSEVTIVVTPELCKAIAEFFAAAAIRLAEGKTDHMHISSFSKEWRESNPNKDIIAST